MQTHRALTVIANLRQLDFQGFVMSDWQAQHSGVSDALAGLDMTMPGDTLFLTGAR